MEIIIENVRSLCGFHRIPVKPLTLLVGENSTGKSTFLAMIMHVFHPQFPSLRPSFNIPPFDLGTYDSIATFKGGRFGRVKSFSVGIDYPTRKKNLTVVANYMSKLGQPQLSTLSISQNGTEVRMVVDPRLLAGKVMVKVKDMAEELPLLDLESSMLKETRVPLSYFIGRLLYIQERTKLEIGIRRRVESVLLRFRRLFEFGSPQVMALAPVRTRPRRTYDEITDEFKPEGDHVPVMLARIWQGVDDPRRQRLAHALAEFGRHSSLFKGISVKRLGKRPSDPFQILVTVAGPSANLPDVGYGVSQALPLIVQSVMAAQERRMLLQQPEVHLHPRGQAALGSFFAKLVARDEKEFVIETHSDYLVDRIRLEVARKSISNKDVLILFFEKQGIETKVHPIYLDSSGNLLEPPESYRSFFMQEETDLLTRTGF